VHTFSITLKTAGSDSITATDVSASSVTGSATVTVSAAAASQLIVSGLPTSIAAGTAGTLTVKAQDAYGNVAKSYAGTVHFTSSDSQASLPADYLFVGADNGVHSFSVTMKTAGTQSITATDKTTTSIMGTESGISVAAAAASRFALSGFPTSTTAGTTGTVTVTAQDAFGNVAKSYAGTAHFTSTDSQSVLPPDYTFVSGDNGVHSFSVTLKTSGTESISATDKTTMAITGTQAGISVAAAAASTLLVSGFPTSATAGIAGTVTVTAQDVFGNVAKSYTGTVHFASSDSQAALPLDYSFVSGDNGTHSFSVTFKTSGTQSIIATDTTSATITGMQAGITVNVGASQLVLSGFPTAATAGTAGTVTVTAQDAFGNVAKNYTGTVHFASGDPQAVLPANYTFVSGDSGAHSFSITLKTSGAQTFTATDTATSAVSGSANVTVSAAAASTLLVSGYPTPTTAGTAHNFTVTAKDAFGNTATGFLAPVSFTSSDSQAMLPAPYTYTSADAGVHTFSAMFQTVGTESLTATDPPVSGSGPSGTEANIVVDAAAPLVTSESPTANASGVATGAAVTATFNESVQQATISFVLTDASKNMVPATLTYNDTTHTATLTPGGPLLNSTTYTATVSGATDQAGNSMTAPVSWSFTTVAAINHWVQSTAADFNTGNQNGTALADPANGGLQLAPSFFDDFQGTTPSSSWTSRAWVTGGTVSVSGGILSLAGAEVASTQTLTGTPVEGRVNFAAAANQQFGLATGLGSTSGNSWALFSTKGTKNTLYARVNVAGVTHDLKLGALPSGFHVYRVTPVAGSVYFYIDGVLKTVVTATLPGGTGLHIVASATNRSLALQVDWVRVVSYPASGTFTSTIFDATRAANWSTVTWNASVPAGTALTVQVRYGNTATPDSTWSAWTSVSNGGNVSASSARYVQYRVILTTSDPTLTPVLNSIDFTWS
jgi:FKBP-type peptidyl-prolyl cis-trans isomerase 2